MRVLVHKEADMWIAQGIDFDVCAQAPSQRELKPRFIATAKATNLSTVGAPPAESLIAMGGTIRRWRV